MLSLCVHAFVFLQGGSPLVIDSRVSHFDARLMPPRPPALMPNPILSQTQTQTPSLAVGSVKKKATVIDAAAALPAGTGAAVPRMPLTTPAVPASGLDPAPVFGEGARAYRLSIASALRQVQGDSPELKGVGDPRMIRFVLSMGSGGGLQGLRIVESSGSNALEAAATSMIRSAMPLATLPETLQGKAFSIEVAMEISP